MQHITVHVPERCPQGDKTDIVNLLYAREGRIKFSEQFIR